MGRSSHPQLFASRLLYQASLLAIICWLPMGIGALPDKSQASVLLSKLVENYGPKTLRPVYNISHPTNVAIRIFVTQIIELNEREQFVQISGFTRLKWRDEMFSWNTTEYPDVDKLYISDRDIWTPDITMYTKWIVIHWPPRMRGVLVDHDPPLKTWLQYAYTVLVTANEPCNSHSLFPGRSVDEFFERTKEIPLAVYPDGTVHWNFPAILKSSCRIDTLLFPFDSQRCGLVFGSWVFAMREINLTKDTPSENTLNKYFVSNGVWELDKIEVILDMIQYSCCPDPFPMVTFHLHLTRRPLHYILSILLPALLLAIISLSIYVLPPNSGEKISLGVTTLLALLLFQELISGSLPPSSERTPIISYFFTPMVVIGCTSILSSVVILNLHHRSSHRPVPEWLRYLTFRILAPILCYGRAKKMAYNSARSGPKRSATIVESWPHTPVNNAGESTTDGMLLSFGHMANSNENSNSDADNIPMNSVRDLDLKQCCCHQGSCCRLKTMERLTEGHDEGALGSDLPVNEWQELALVLDRMMLLIMTATMLTSLTATIVLFIAYKETP